MLADQEVKQEKVQPHTPQQAGKPAEMRILKPKINLSVCEKNYNCVVFCPRNAISINQKSWPVITYDLCDGCLICLRECPTSAILEER
ncbi:MAG: 4Fe-4S binding protein [Candidatus Aenigmarchaeota archaeon]|nr:4Fe-4S binding protein [Candidatus Aenigmarchaeota archaeon]